MAIGNQPTGDIHHEIEMIRINLRNILQFDDVALPQRQLFAEKLLAPSPSQSGKNNASFAKYPVQRLFWPLEQVCASVDVLRSHFTIGDYPNPMKLLNRKWGTPVLAPV